MGESGISDRTIAPLPAKRDHLPATSIAAGRALPHYWR